VTPAPRPAMLTARGRGLVAAAGGLLVAAWLFGSAELAGLGAAAGAAVAVASVVVGRAPATYRAERWLAPARVGVGEPAAARLRFTNAGPRPTATTAVAADAVGSTSARCVVPALGPGAMAEAAYDLPTARRGAITVGPLSIAVADPLGLAERRIDVAGTARLVVHPRVHPVLALPRSSTPEGRQGSTGPARAARGDDFFALREYEVGDDLRRVHWRSTARLGELMLRQDELRFGSVATVLLDTRARAHRGDSFERALEVAASVAAALVEDGRRLRFLTTGGFDVEFDGAGGGIRRRRGEGKWTAVLEHLALVSPDRGGADRFALAVQSIGRRPGGPLAVVVADASPAELAALGALRSRLGLVVIARCRADTGERADAATEASTQAVAGAVVVAVGDTRDFPGVWNQAVLSCGRRDAVRR
jgi:uncharacterized protein (DUF58 family)